MDVNSSCVHKCKNWKQTGRPSTGGMVTQTVVLQKKKKERTMDTHHNLDISQRNHAKSKEKMRKKGQPQQVTCFMIPFM